MTRSRSERRDKKAAYYATWYQENGDAVNERRRNRYASDPEYREKVKARARERKRQLLADRDGRVEREWDGTKILVHPISRVAEDAGTTAQRIRELESQGVIPEATFPGETRVYTDHQRTLIIRFLEAARDGRAGLGHYKRRMAETWLKGLDVG